MVVGSPDVDLSPALRAIGAVEQWGGHPSAVVQAGVSIDELNAELSRRKNGLFFAPDPATTAQSAIGGKVGVVPRLFLKKLIGEVLDRVDQFPDFDPRTDYALTLVPAEMTEVERNAASADEVTLDLP